MDRGGSLSSRKKPSERLAERGQANADSKASDAPFDPLTAPLASELEGEEAVFGGDASSLHEGSIGVRTRAPEDPYLTKPIPAPAKRPPRRRPFRRVKSTIKHIDPLSVLKLSLFFYGCLLVLWLLFVAFVYWIVESMGAIEAYDDFREGLVIWEHAKITFFVVEKWALIVGLVLMTLGSVMNAFLAFLYNIASDTVGGLQLTFLDRDY
jgi:hypothetical protein